MNENEYKPIIIEIEPDDEIEGIKEHLDFLRNNIHRITELNPLVRTDVNTIANNYLRAIRNLRDNPPILESSLKFGDTYDSNEIKNRLATFQNQFILSIQLAELKSSFLQNS